MSSKGAKEEQNVLPVKLVKARLWKVELDQISK